MTEAIENYLKTICKNLELHKHCTMRSRTTTYSNHLFKLMALQEIEAITMEEYIEYKHKIADILGV